MTLIVTSALFGPAPRVELKRREDEGVLIGSAWLGWGSLGKRSTAFAATDSEGNSRSPTTASCRGFAVAYRSCRRGASAVWTQRSRSADSAGSGRACEGAGRIPLPTSSSTCTGGAWPVIKKQATAPSA